MDADVGIEQVLFPEAHGERHRPVAVRQCRRVIDFGIEQVVARRLGFECAEVVLRESVQQVYARRPVCVAIIDPATCPPKV